MEFNTFQAQYDLYRQETRNPDPFSKFYVNTIAKLHSLGLGAAEINQMLLELMWFEGHRPYYNVYPGVIKGFLNLRRDNPVNQLVFPEPAFSVRFAKGKEPFTFQYDGMTHATKSLIVCKSPEVDNLLSKGKQKIQDDKILLYLDMGERAFDVNVYTYIAMPLIAGMTIEEALYALPPQPAPGPILPDEFRRAIVKILSAICLLGDDVDLKEFDVLNKDFDKYLKTHDPKYIDKAKRRGKFGWVIGRRCEDEKSPTYVNPHFQHYHVGKGRTQIILKHKQGFFVKKETIKKVPTGHLDKP